MASNSNENLSGRPGLSRFTFYVIGLLAALLLVCGFISWNTRDAMTQLAFLRGQRKASKPGSSESALVDTRPWQMAQELAPMAVSAEEVQFSREAERLAGHEVDQAFASALHQAQVAAQHRALTGEALDLSHKISQLQAVVNSDQAHVQDLTQRAGQATQGNDELDLAKAQLGLDSDELADAQQDLARALGDDRIQIQQELTAHQDAVKKFESESTAQKKTAVATSRSYGTLAARLSAWLDQRARYNLIQQAQQQASSDAATLTAQHSRKEKQFGSGPAAPDGNADTASRMKAIQSRSMHSQMLGILDDRIQTHDQLATVYSRWAAQVELQHRIVLHLLMQSLSWVLSILICGFLLDALARRFLFQMHLERRRLHTLLIITKLSLEVVTGILVLLVVFGPPNQTPTIVGLTTAGLTVVLQDFIISFCGWFVLMGKNGIRVGDWVEINSVGGEVIDVGLFRTSMLEIGNWTDHGHPTGRKVTFMNSFAIKGQFFNFSTTGQWMWDELAVTIHPSDDTYAIVQMIHKAITEETEQESRMAEQEWVRLGHDGGLSQFSTAPAINLRPGLNGIDLMVRYITRANNRFEVRNRLYGRVIGLLHPVAENPPLKTVGLETVRTGE